jgi:hypothetical protein
MPNDYRMSPLSAVLHIIGRIIALVIVILWTILDELLFPLFRPLVAWLSRLRIFEAIGALIARSPPYLVLLMLAIPFVALEPLKIFALYWTAIGHIVQGTALLVFAHVLSIFTLDRIYHTGKVQLMQIGWFARLMGWIVGLRNWAFGWVKSTPAWQAAARMVIGVRNWFRTLFTSAHGGGR